MMVCQKFEVLPHSLSSVRHPLTTIQTTIHANIIKKSEKNEDFFVLLAF